MTEKSKHDSIYAALVASQSEFGAVRKGSVNPAFKSKYADLADVAAAVIPTLSAHGVVALHYFVGDAMRTEFCHAATQTKVWCDVPLIVDRQNMQGMKSATTYAKRIGLESLSGIAPEDDDGNAAAANTRSTPKPAVNDEAVAIAIASLTGADTLDQLAAIWKGLPGWVKRVPDVIEAKDKRKFALEKPAPTLEYPDEIPH